MTKENLGQDLGRLFEVGFNVGILTYIEQHQLNHNFGDLYRQDLSKLSFPKILRRLADKEQVTSEQHRHIAEKWSTFFLQKGFLAGLNFFSEYIKSTGWNKRHLKRLQILYYQCCFCDDNSIGTYPKGKDRAFKEVLSQFGDSIDIGKYAKKGEFLNADTLMLLQRDKEIRVLCVDLSVFSIKTIRDLVDVDSVEVIKSILLSEISYLKSKSVFSNLGLDTKNLGLNFNQDLASYFTAFKREDKETVKLIQAASYTHSFYEFLRSRHLIPDETSVVFNVVGYSDRSINAMSLTQDNLQVLATCANIYKQESSDKQINAARKEVLNLIRRNAAKSFKDGKEFINRLEVPANQITLVTHQERIDDFFNSTDTIPPDLAAQLQLNSDFKLRDAHAELIKRELASDSLYIFLTGNPGIGKTTAIANFLKSQNCLNEGFLFFYVSPRKQVNLDIIEKFQDEKTKTLCSNLLLTINTNADLIKNNGGRCTVNYLSNQREESFTVQTVQFIDQRDNIERYTRSSKSIKRTKEDRIQELGKKTRGVLDSICEAIYTIIDQNISNNIIATVSIQSLKKTQDGRDTLEHFEKIFRNAYKERDGLVIPVEMQKISSRIKHLFIMIDEITGDDSGVEFLSRISSILHKYELTDSRHGFNTKVIVADASIVDKNVIQQHLLDTSAEPNKIFFRPTSGNSLPLTLENFNFNEFKASVINTNSYPAKSLKITYKVLIESVKFSQKAVLKREKSLRERVQAEIVKDIKDLLQHPQTEQIIVYVQDKPRLAELIQTIRDDRGEFQPYRDYLEIHSNLSEQDKKEINKYKNDVKIIFMTASASRGLSFPKTKHILVDIPRFEIEKNLMEIIQVIYRGRGGYIKDGIYQTLDNEEKEIVFYLSERSVYYVKNDSLSSQDYAEEHELSLQESVLNILNLLLILKASIMTRISGYGRVGQDNYIIIPIGGKSVIAAGQTFSGKMNPQEKIYVL